MNISQLGKNILTATIAICIAFASFAQKELKLVISGTVYVDNMRLSGVNVLVYQSGSVVAEDVSDNNGKFEIEMSIDDQYELIFEKDDFATKKVEVDGRNIPENDRKFDFYNKGWKIDMVPLDLGVDVSILKQPVAKLIYNSAEEQFTIDKKYDREVRPDLDQLAEDVYNAYVRKDMEAEDKFDDYMLAVKDGDLFLKEGDYENAMMQYEAAKELMPEETYPDKQIKKTLALMAENADIDELYAQHLSKADEAFDNEKWEESKGFYKMALDVKPKMDYPKDQIAKADLKIELAAQNAAQLAIAEKKKLYDDQVKKADSLLGINMLAESKSAFNKALDMDSKQAYPKAKIKEIDGLIADQNAAEKAYMSLLANANKFFQERKFDEAKAAYTQALGINPDDEEPKEKIKEIDVLLASIAALKSKEEELAKRKAEALEQEYLSAISVADALMVDEKYAEAKAEYERALTIKAGEEYPTAQVSDINAKLAAIEGAEKQYQNAMAAAKGFEAKEDWEKAKASYSEAQAAKPSETAPAEAIAAIDAKLAQMAADAAAAQKAIDDKYAALIATADEQLASEKYNEALASYTEAQGVKDSETYPAQQISKINAKLAELEGIDKQYSNAMAEAKKLEDAEKYEDAKVSYGKAQGFKPNETAPTEAIAAIDAKLAQMAADAAAAQKAIDDKYAALISTADEQLASEKYNEALASYTEAQGVKESETYPAQQISKINAKLAELEGVEKQYAKVLAEAQKKEQSGDLEGAKTSYSQALELKPNEQVPTEAIAAIDAKLAQMAADAAAAQKAIDDKYAALIATADEQLASEKYNEALASYTEAQGVKDSEAYPTQQISKINAKLAELEGIEKQYTNAMAEAKRLEDAEKYEDAKVSYGKAQGFKPNEPAPTEAIAAIDAKLAQMAADAAAAQKATDDKYAALISTADEQLASEKYNEALASYTEAQGVKESETYPAQQISKINAKLAEIEGIEKQYSKVIAEAQKKEQSGDLEGAKTSYSQALELKPNEQVPTDAIAAIDAKLAQMAADAAAAQKAIDDAYNGHVAKGDELFAAEDYEGAKVSYQEASKVKSDEEYPKSQMAVISDKLAAIAAAKAAAEAEAKALAEKEAKYKELITKADGMFNADQLEEAKAVYQEAKAVDADKAYPAQQITVIDEKLAVIAAELAAKQKAEAEAKAINDAYQAAIAKADGLLASKDYENAKQAYLDAKKIKVDETYPDTKIAEIDAAVLAAAKAAEEAEAERQRLAALEEEFNSLMKEAADLEAEKKYTNAKYKYEAAQKLKPENTDIPPKLRELANKIEEARKLAEFRAKNDTEFNRQLARDYPNGLNETKKEGSKTTTRIVIVDGDRGDEYRKEKYNYGAVFYFKNGKKVDATTYERETKGH